MATFREDILRGERLFPPRMSRTYWVLSELRRAYERMVDYCSREGVQAVVDYGCGNMPYRPLFEAKGIKYRGFDFPTNDKADGALTPEGGLPLESDQCPAVLSSQVLEHVADPNAYLQEARRVLTSGGLLLLSTHGVWKYHPDPLDLWRWTGEGLKKMVADNGFVVQAFEGVVGPAAMGIQLFQDAFAGNIPRVLRRLFLGICQTAMQTLDRRCPAEVKARDAGVYLLRAVKA